MLTVDKVKKTIYSYGEYPALHILRELEDLQDFENCKIFKEALDSIVNVREWYLSTKTDDVSLNKTYNNILGVCNNPKLINNNMLYYIDKFKKITINQ
jgi:hypothetical protein